MHTYDQIQTSEIFMGTLHYYLPTKSYYIPVTVITVSVTVYNGMFGISELITWHDYGYECNVLESTTVTTSKGMEEVLMAINSQMTHHLLVANTSSL